MFHDCGGGTVGKKSQTPSCAIVQALWCYLLPLDTQYCFFAFCFENLHMIWMNGQLVSLWGGHTCFLMVFHAILRQILISCFCAISSLDLSVCATLRFFNYGWGWWMQNMKLQNANPVLSYFRSDQIGSGQNCMHTNAL